MQKHFYPITVALLLFTSAGRVGLQSKRTGYGFRWPVQGVRGAELN